MDLFPDDEEKQRHPEDAMPEDDIDEAELVLKIYPCHEGEEPRPKSSSV